MRPRKKDRHLPACVYLRHGSYWHVKAGKWTRLGSELPAALSAYAKTVSAPAGALPKLIDQTLASLAPHISATTLAQYRQAAARLKDIFIEHSPETVTSADVVQFRDSMADKPNMANRMLSFLKQVFDMGVQQRMIDSNPCVGVRRMAEAKRDRYIDDTEFLAIYTQAGPRLQVIMDLLYLTGQRPVDILTLRRTALRDEGIYFRQQKTGNQLIVAWTPELRLAIDRAKNLGGKVSALTVLHGRRGRAPDYSSVKQQWDDARTAAKIEDVQLRDIRAKAITDAEAQGHNPQAIAGHSSAAMTKRYLRLHKTPIVQGPRKAAK